MKDTKMTLSTIFRVCVIVAAVSIIIAFASYISAVFEEDDIFVGRVIEKVAVSARFYFISLAATIGAVVLSILGTKYAKKVSVVARTFFLAFVAGFYYAGYKLTMDSKLQFEAYFIAMVLGCVVLGILTFTSIHWFAKKKDAE